MAKYTARTRAEITAALRAIKAKNNRMIADMRGSNLAKVGMQAGFIVEARAKEIITEKGHVVTGNLKRSINTQILEVDNYSAVIGVGTFLVYGPFIENLPDGGYLLPASIETNPEVTRFLWERGVRPVLERWGA